jgi:hypothetical protein
MVFGKYFNPSGAVDSIGYIFDLIDIKQASDISIITLNAWLSHLFASLKLGGIAINPALQVAFMLWALQSHYHRVVEDFYLGHHSLPSSTLQSVVNQCTAYDKDPWNGPVGKDGKPAWTPSANVAGTSGNGTNPYDILPTCSFNLHMARWRNGCKDGSDKCMVCHNTSNKPTHHSKDCPMK